MKISTSTSFVMAATASLALQSSALALPSDSPDVALGSPRSARTATTARFSDRAGTVRSGSRERSQTRRDTLGDLASTSVNSIDGLTDDMSAELKFLGLGIAVRGEPEKGAGESPADRSLVLPSSALPASIPSQVGSTVTQTSSATPSAVDTITGRPAQVGDQTPEPLVQVAPNNAPQPPVPNQATQDSPLNREGAATGAVQVINDAVKEVARENFGQTASEQSEYNDTAVSDLSTNQKDGLASPSSTIATPSSSPSSSPVVTSSTDAAASSPTDTASDSPTSVGFGLGDFNIFPTPAPINPNGASTPSLPVPVPAQSNLPVSPFALTPPSNPPAGLPINSTSGLSSLPDSLPISPLPTSPPSFLQGKRTAVTRGEVSYEKVRTAEDELIASNATPPLLGREEIVAGASASLTSPTSAVSGTSQPTTTTASASPDASPEAPTSPPSRRSRFRFFRFSRKANA